MLSAFPHKLIPLIFLELEVCFALLVCLPISFNRRALAGSPLANRLFKLLF